VGEDKGRLEVVSADRSDGAATIMCVVGSNSINARRVAALASLYSITETALDEYKAKVVETIGETKSVRSMMQSFRII